MKDYKRRKWHKQRNRNFLIALIISLSFVFWAFGLNFDIEPRTVDAGTYEIVHEVNQVRTPSSKKKVKMMNEKLSIDLTDEFISEDLGEIIDNEEAIDSVGDFQIAIEHKGTKGKVKLEKFPEEADETPRIHAEIMPFYGDCISLSGQERKTCSDNSILNFLQENIKYPVIARESNIEGTVVIGFTVTKLGEITDVEIIREIGGGCGNEAKRVIESMSNWNAGIQNGKRVPVIFKIPVKFRLQ